MERSRSTKHAEPAAIRETKNEPTDLLRAVLEKDGDGVNDPPAARGLTFEDEEWIAFERALSALKEALGTDDADFCIGILRQLEGLAPFGHWGDRTDFNFVLSVLKSAKPVDVLHAMLVLQMAVGQLAVMKQSQILVKFIRFELPLDFKWAIHNARYDTSRLDKQKIRIDDQPVRQVGERMVTRLMQTYAMQLQTSAAYRKAAEPSVKAHQVSARQVLREGTEMVRQQAPNNAPTPSLRELNGSRQSAAAFTDCSNHQANSINSQKSNGRASS